jgi:hypothetical protein
MRTTTKVGLLLTALLLTTLALVGASAAAESETPPTAEVVVQTDPWVDPTYRAKVIAQNRRARAHQRVAHVWSHKLGKHGPGTHTALKLTKNLTRETARADAWVIRATTAREAYQACLPNRPRPLVSPRTTVKHRRASIQQRRNITEALNIARKRGVPLNHRLGLLAAITQESSANNLGHGHGTSVGILQLINIHGTVAWRMHLPNSVGWFLNGARKVDPRGRLAPGTLAQAVQRSAHPTLYHQWVPEAKRTYKLYLAGCPSF